MHRAPASRTAAQMPIASWLGMRPMAAVDPDINRTVRTRIFLRPSLSPSRPKMIPPRGRSAKATAKTAKASRRPITGSVELKKVAAMWVAM